MEDRLTSGHACRYRSTRALVFNILTVCSPRPKSLPQAFDIFDTDQDGFISIEDLRQCISAELGETVPDKEVRSRCDIACLGLIYFMGRRCKS